METVETHFVETKDYVYRTKVDLVKNESEEIIRFKVVCYDRVVEFDKNMFFDNPKNSPDNHTNCIEGPLVWKMVPK